MLHVPAPRGAKNHERVVDREQNSQDAPRASAGARQKQQEGSQCTFKIRTAPQRKRFDAHETCRGFDGDASDSHGATTGAIRHARSPQRVRREFSKFARRHNGSDSTRTIPGRGFDASFQNSHGTTTGAIRHARSPQRVRREFSKFARRHNGSDSTRTIPAEGSTRVFKIRTAPQRERFDTHDPRRGFDVSFQNLHGATTGAIRHARSPQRVRREFLKFARRHNGSDPTRTIPAEFDASFQNSHGATTEAIRHARSPQRVRRGFSKFARRHNGSDATRTIPGEGSTRVFKIRTAPQRERCDAHETRRGCAPTTPDDPTPDLQKEKIEGDAKAMCANAVARCR